MARLFIFLGLLAIFTPPARAASHFSAADEKLIHAAVQEYALAWLTNKPEAVMATITPDAVLLPSGMEAIVGADKIHAFWWPVGGAPVAITAMTQTVDDIAGDGDTAIVRGRGTLSFTMLVDGKNVQRDQRSTFLEVLSRQPDGRWLITHRMWSDLK